MLRRAGFRPTLATSGSDALRLIDELQPDLLVLDLTLVDGHGLETLKAVRRSSDLPIIVLSTSVSEDDLVQVLELGADDYVTKPIAFRAMLARIRAVLRRQMRNPQPPAPTDDWIRVGPLALNPSQHKAKLEGLPLSLTVTEFRLLQLLMDNSDSVVPHRGLLKQIWGYDDPTATDVVRAAISRLRRKLAEASDQPPTLRTIPGVGVTLQCSAKPLGEFPRPAQFEDRVATVDDTLLATMAA
jgi:DNA-binding response OmpR family regulator